MARLLIWFKKRSSLISLLVLLIVIPLYPKFPISEVKGTWVAIRLDDFLVLGVLLVWGLNQLLRGWPVLKNKIFPLFALYWMAGIVSNFSAVFITGFAAPKLVFFHWLRRVEYMSLFFVAADAIAERKNLKTIFSFIGIAAFGVFAYGLGQKYWGFPVISTMNEEFSKGIPLYLDKWTRISSTFAGHYDLAVWTMMVLAFSPAAIVFLKNKWQKMAAFIAAAASFYFLTLTASRVSFCAYLLAIIITLILLKKCRFILPIFLISVFFGFRSPELNARLTASFKTLPFSAFVIEKISAGEKMLAQISKLEFKRKGEKILPEEKQPVVPTIVEKEKPAETIKPTPVKEKVEKVLLTWPTPEETQAAAARSSAIRFEVEWPRALRSFYKNPLLGTGFSSLGLATDNDYLRLLGETGILGFLSFILIIFHLLKTALLDVLKKGDHWVLSAGMVGLIVGFCANAFFIDVFEASKVAFYFWLLVGVVL